jgi:hypothetical protein
MKWEQIDDHHDRSKIFGGWLVKASTPVVHNMIDTGHGMSDGWDWRIALCFVPDPNHEWTIEEVQP